MAQKSIMIIGGVRLYGIQYNVLGVCGWKYVMLRIVANLIWLLYTCLCNVRVVRFHASISLSHSVSSGDPSMCSQTFQGSWFLFYFKSSTCASRRLSIFRTLSLCVPPKMWPHLERQIFIANVVIALDTFIMIWSSSLYPCNSHSPLNSVIHVG